jgi:hypothetical protein
VMVAPWDIILMPQGERHVTHAAWACIKIPSARLHVSHALLQPFQKRSALQFVQLADKDSMVLLRVKIDVSPVRWEHIKKKQDKFRAKNAAWAGRRKIQDHAHLMNAMQCPVSIGHHKGVFNASHLLLVLVEKRIFAMQDILAICVDPVTTDILEAQVEIAKVRFLAFIAFTISCTFLICYNGLTRLLSFLFDIFAECSSFSFSVVIIVIFLVIFLVVANTNDDLQRKMRCAVAAFLPVASFFQGISPFDNFCNLLFDILLWRILTCGFFTFPTFGECSFEPLVKLQCSLRKDFQAVHLFYEFIFHAGFKSFVP